MKRDPDERKPNCGCYAEEVAGKWRITGSAFTCPHRHNFYDALAPELVDILTAEETSR